MGKPWLYQNRLIDSTRVPAVFPVDTLVYLEPEDEWEDTERTNITVERNGHQLTVVFPMCWDYSTLWYWLGRHLGSELIVDRDIPESMWSLCVALGWPEPKSLYHYDTTHHQVWELTDEMHRALDLIRCEFCSERLYRNQFVRRKSGSVSVIRPLSLPLCTRKFLVCGECYWDVFANIHNRLLIYWSNLRDKELGICPIERKKIREGRKMLRALRSHLSGNHDAFQSLPEELRPAASSPAS